MTAATNIRRRPNRSPSAAAVVGPVAGGAITQGLAWQWIFWLNVPIGLLAIPLVLLAFTGWELRARAPMLPMRLFRSRAFSAGNAAIFFMAQFQQTALGQDPLEAGLRLLPWGVAPFLIAPRAGALSDRIGERPLIVAGLLSQTAAMGWLALIVRPGLPYPAMIAPMLLSGCGLAMAIPAATKAVVSSATQADIGKAAGAFSTMRQLGGAFGVAIGVAVFTAAGSYASPRTFSDGFAVTLGGCAALALAGAAAALLMPARATAAPRPPGQADVAASRGPEPQAAPGQAWRERSSRI
jgi:MFS family permease